jgi:Na+/H+ antiporter NhaC
MASQRIRVLTATLPVAIVILVLALSASALADSPSEGGPTPGPGWLTLLPPLLAIAFALLFRQVVPALLAGIWLGAAIFFGGPFVGALRVLDHYMVGELADRDHVSIILFTLLLGGMIGIIARSGGTIGLVEALRPYATNTRRGQLVTWLLGLLVFFDDYANTLLVGNSMRPVTDRLRISREKLAYIVDSTAAPVAAIGVVSTWIGYEISLIGDALRAAGAAGDAYTLFLRAIPYNFYPILSLVFGLIVATTLRDFGPMGKAEERARGGKLLADTAVPLADFDSDALRPSEEKPHRWFNAVIPIAVVLVVVFCALALTGRSSLAESGDRFGTVPFFRLGLQGVGAVFGAGDSYKGLLWGAAAGSLTAFLLAAIQRILTLGEALGAWIHGVRSLTMAMVILVLAWSIGRVCEDLGTGSYIAQMLAGLLDPKFLPLLVFVFAAFIAFATGTSWATMAILIPIAVENAIALTGAAGFAGAAAERILLGAVAAVLAGAIFGDHCSPISDTTVLSSMSSGCDHVDHVRTQLPYALAVAGASVVFGYLPSAFGLPVLPCLLLGSAALGGLLYAIGRPTEATANGA